MATLGNTYLSLADVYKRTLPNGNNADIIELLAKINPILDDAIALECNNGTKHITTVRTGLPSATWRKLYQAVQPVKSATAQVEDSTGMLEAWSEVDAELIRLAGDNGAHVRMSEAEAFLQGMSNDMATAVFYESTLANPERFLGLAPRFSLINTTDPNKYGYQIVNLGGATALSQTSMWFVVWHPMTCHLLYPKGTQAGVEREDKGKQTKETASGLYDVMREKFLWRIGMSVRDHRYISRLANIDSTLFNIASPSAANMNNLINAMIDCFYKVRQRRVGMGGNAAIYCNTGLKSALHKAALNKASNALTLSQYGGQEIVSFNGWPIREVDALIWTEAVVS